jgi:site-specific DNA recombinase
LDAAYDDKLNGAISREFWDRKQREWQSEEQRLRSLLSDVNAQKFEDRLLDMYRILELAQAAHSLYLTRKPEEQGELLKKIVLNCAIDATTLYPTYRKPFDLIARRAKTSEWSGREDLNRLGVLFSRSRSCKPMIFQGR